MAENSRKAMADQRDEKWARYRLADQSKLTRLIEKAVAANQPQLNFYKAAIDIVMSLGESAREDAKTYYLLRYVVNELRRGRDKRRAEERPLMLPGFETQFIRANSLIRVNGTSKLMATAPLEEVEADIRARETKASSIDRRRAQEARELVAKARELKCSTLHEAAAQLALLVNTAKAGK